MGGVWLQNDPRVDLPKIKATLDELGWSGWPLIERSRDTTRARDVSSKSMPSILQTASAKSVRHILRAARGGCRTGCVGRPPSNARRGRR